jgi:hypothetical protein
VSLLSNFADEDSFDLVAHGRLTPKETKATLIPTLRPYFTDVSALEKLAVVLAPEAVNLRAIERDKTSQQLYSKVTSDYQKAEAADSAACYEACRHWEQKIQDGLAEYWSALRLNIDLPKLNINDFKFETFRIIGLLIEAVMQPALRELLFQTRLAVGRKVAEDDIDRADLGAVIEELARASSYTAFLAPAPWNVMLNQWRNMAHHFSTRVQGGRIVGVYGKGKNKKKLELSRDELFTAVKTIHSISRALKTARTMFILNRIDQIGFELNTLQLRDDVKLLHLESAFAVQGFELVRVGVTPVAGGSHCTRSHRVTS